MRLGITTQGSPVLVGLAPGSDEGHDPWAGFLGELVERGLRAPLLVITDGAPGLVGAVEVVFSHSLRQRGVVHRARNLLAKVPKHAQDEVKQAFWQVFDDLDAEPGEAAVAQARQRAHAFADRYQGRYPAAVACLTDTLPELTCFLRFPREHWARIRHTNLIERTFGETRRRVKVIGRLPANAAACRWCGRCWTGPRVAGVGWS